VAVAEIKSVERIFVQALETSDVRPCEIDHVRVVANARTIARWIVFTVNGNFFSLVECNLQHQRNQMTFRLMRFAVFLRRASSIEITKRDRAQTVDLVVPL